MSRSEEVNEKTTSVPPPDTLEMKELPKIEQFDFGFHRVIGGHYYGFVLDIFAIILGLVAISVIIPMFFPYPEIMGYTKVVQALFGFMFGIFDVGMAGTQGNMSSGMIRFISQYAHIDTRRAFKYVQFFVFWQAFTGIAQVSIVSIYVLTVLIHTDLAHLVWFMLGYGLIQFPGFLQVFESSLDGFQDFGKKSLVAWMRDLVFQNGTQVVLILLGRAWGAANPAIGELMGITIFYVISLYSADFLGVLFGGVLFFRLKLIKDAGLRFRDLFGFNYKQDKQIIIQCFSFIGRMWVFGQVLGFIGLFIQVWTISLLGAYGAWYGILSAMGGLSALSARAAPMVSKTMSPVSEAYNNKKKQLARWHLHNMWKWVGSQTFMVTIPLVLLLPGALNNLVAIVPGLENYASAVVVMPLLLIKNAFQAPGRLAGDILIATHQPNKVIILDYVMAPIGWFTLWVTLGVLQLGWVSLILSELFPSLIRIVLSLIWVQRSVLQTNYRTVAWQALIAPALAAIPYSLIMLQFLWLWDFWTGLLSVWGFVILVVAGVFLVFEMFIWSPLYALFGGWDDNTLNELQRATNKKYAGPSTRILSGITKITTKFCRLSPLHARFPITGYADAMREYEELRQISTKNAK